jgi:hypothetical protein
MTGSEKQRVVSTGRKISIYRKISMGRKIIAAKPHECSISRSTQMGRILECQKARRWRQDRFLSDTFSRKEFFCFS